jgi:aminoglycoside phosphotransferase (APT) family kinase protein
LTDLAQRFARFLEANIDGATDVVVERMDRIHGGASRETYRWKVRWQEGDREVERGLILRRDPQSSLIETKREIEYGAYRAFQDTSVPVPAALFLETDSQWLERPFFVMEEVVGTPANPFQPDPYAPHAEGIGEQFWTILGHIAAADWRANGLDEILEAPEPKDCWRRELDHWEGVIDQDELEPQPIARAAIRWLRRNPPPPAQRISVVHGDYRSGNFLFDGDGKVRAILDWEMCHLGDPLEDLAWAFDPLWAAGDTQRPAQLVERVRAIELWEQSSGLHVTAAAFEWWQIFAHVKGLAIWISSSKEYSSGANTDPIFLVSGWLCTDRHNRILVEKLAAKVGGGR